MLGLPSRNNSFQNVCVAGIVIGGVMIGEKDMLSGNSIGYICCMLFNLSEAVMSQYSSHLYRKDNF